MFALLEDVSQFFLREPDVPDVLVGGGCRVVKDYYSENDPFAARWLRKLGVAGLIPMGDADERSIVDVPGADVAGCIQCHWFAGVGGWPLALRLAGWPDEWPVWTGSCPCQPFSIAGKRKGIADERHLWPDFYRLIAECKPATIFGEQVASKDGREWLAGIRADLEELGYAVGCADLCAAGAGAGAPHIRQRLYWVANSPSIRSSHGHEQPGMFQSAEQSQRSRPASGMGHAASTGLEGQRCFR